MTKTQLLLVLLVIAGVILLAWLLVRRASARKDRARAEAAGIRAEAQGLASMMASHELFAEQARERAEVARAEAEAAQREAEQLALQASEQRTVVEDTRADYASMLGRADEVDPDVDAPMTRAEARRRREEAERAAWAGRLAPADATPALDDATPALDDGTRAPDDEPGDDRSARIAAAADYRDETGAERLPGEPAPVEAGEPREDGGTGSGEVWTSPVTGTETAMTDISDRERLTDATDTSAVDTFDDPALDDPALDDPALDARTPTSDWGGPHADTSDPEPVLVGGADLPDAADEAPVAGQPRRVSEFHEIRDGGYGMGSAAALEDGVQPMDHPVQGYRDTMTYRVPGDPGYDEADPDVWFYDASAAERSGFRRSEG